MKTLFNLNVLISLKFQIHLSNRLFHYLINIMQQIAYLGRQLWFAFLTPTPLPHTHTQKCQNSTKTVETHTRTDSTSQMSTRDESSCWFSFFVAFMKRKGAGGGGGGITHLVQCANLKAAKPRQDNWLSTSFEEELTQVMHTWG